MNVHPSKVIALPAASVGDEGLICEACGSPKLTESLCRTCALRLVDVALSSSPENFTILEDDWTGAPEYAPGPARERYDHYEVCRLPQGGLWELGRGTMGITYKAMDTHLNCPVALKIINARRLGGAKARDRFLREARTAARLRHANIASVFHLGLGEDDCFYSMEYIEGETLEALVQRTGAMPWRAALDVVAQSARALQVAHGQDFVHRDIKPSNIMLVVAGHAAGERPLVKLIDFGLAKGVAENILDPICETYFAGTPRYASPEQIESGKVDACSDIFSLGKCLEYMLSGEPANAPVVASKQPAPARPLSRGTAESSGDLPPSVLALLGSMVSPESAQRPQSADEVLQKISVCLARSDAPSNPPLDEKVGRHSARREPDQRRGVKVLGVGLLAAVTISTLLIRGLSPRSGERNQPPAASPPSVTPESRTLYAQATEHYRKYTKENLQQAIGSAAKAVELSPSYADAHALLALLYFESVSRFNAPNAQLDLAVAEAQHAIAVDPNNPKGFQTLGAIRSYQGQPWEALTHLRHALELDAKSAQVMCDFSLLWSMVGEPHLALPWAKAATQLEPSKIRGWHAAAEACVDLGEDQQAEEYYRKCTELQPVWTSAYCGLMHLHLLQKDFEAAKQDFAKVESIQQNSLPALTLKAQVSLFSGDYAQAEREYELLIKMKRDGLVRYYSGISYLSALGFLRLQNGDQLAAQSLLDEAAALHPAISEGPEDVYDLAAIRAVQNRKDAALALLKQAFDSGWKDCRATELDPRFHGLHDHPQFVEMVAELRSRVVRLRQEADALCTKPLDLSDYPVRPNAKNGVK